jgi:cyclic pyranopterin phosphate synthase
MPEEGIRFLPKEQLLSYEELTRISNLFIDLGVDKIRITGGEPFVRKDLLDLLQNLTRNEGLSKLSITTNGILTKPYLPMLKEMGIDQINLSLDTIDEANFKKITRRDDFGKVMDTFHQMIDDGFKVKINVVVMDGINSHEIIDLSRLAINYPVAVRFIEEMPFNGSPVNHKTIKWDHRRILETLKSEYSDLYPHEAPANSTSANFSFNGAKGELGIIAAFTRTFCGTCDRIRLTSTGEMRTCLYGHNVLDLKKILREGHSDKSIEQRIIDVVQKRAKDGFEAEKLRGEQNPIGESMSVIGG